MLKFMHLLTPLLIFLVGLAQARQIAGQPAKNLYIAMGPLTYILGSAYTRTKYAKIKCMNEYLSLHYYEHTRCSVDNLFRSNQHLDLWDIDYNGSRPAQTNGGRALFSAAADAGASVTKIPGNPETRVIDLDVQCSVFAPRMMDLGDEDASKFTCLLKEGL